MTVHKVPYEHLKKLVNNSMVEHLFHEEPCACVERCLAASDDEWFTKRFRKDVPPVLALNNSDLPNHIFKWWQVSSSVQTLAFSFNTSAKSIHAVKRMLLTLNAFMM